MVKQKLDIGFFTSMYSQVNGTAIACRNLAEAMAKYTGHNIHVFAPGINKPKNIPNNLHLHNFFGAKISPKTGFVLSLPLHKYFFCNHDYLDIAHIHTHASFGSMAINWAKYLGIPMTGTHNSPLSFYTAQYIPLLGKLLARMDWVWRYERHVLDKYDLVSVPTKSKKDLLRDQRFKEPIICLTNGISDLYFTDVKENGIRDKYDLDSKKILLYASRLSPEKHQLSVIKSFKKIQKEVPDSHLVLVGSDGPSSSHILKFIKKQNYKDNVSYLGRVPFTDLLKLYNTADLACLWSWIEAEGLVLIEAMAQGTPCVGANAVGISNVIKHGKTGYLANNFDEFNKRVVELFKNDDLRAEMGVHSKMVAHNYRISKVAKTWIKLYKFIINELYPLRYYKKERKNRVELVKEFIHKLPIVSF
ncbi:MAG: glycosyltransferase [Candidatus Lokiarchaeota archaeon]|nr:glycosyltransferase [Candidatus Lokiarchaeota archaeon]